MKKNIKIIIFILSLFLVFIIYKIFSNENEKIIYVPLGDSIAEGMTPYHNIDYGYTDYIKDYLNRKNKLSFYTKKYTKSGYTIQDITNDINNNKIIEENSNKIYLKEILRESDLVTLTVGANNFIKGLNIDDISSKILDMESTKKEIDSILNEYKNLLILLKKYAKNQIIVTGYFNPFQRLDLYKKEVDEIVKYFNYEVESICEELGIIYIDIFDILNNKDFFPNPVDIHPNKTGYKLISENIIKMIDG